MHWPKKIGGIAVVSLVSALVAVAVCYAIAVSFFFDIFFYEKSVAYGYWPAGKNTTLQSFGRRSKDLLALENGELDKSESVHPFTVAVIGDSYTWGQGIRNESLFGEVLEKKLNKKKKSRVIILGSPGNSLLDHVTTYEKLNKSKIKIDAYVFALVTNDILPFHSAHYAASAEEMVKSCEYRYGPIIRDIDWSDQEKTMEEKLERSNSLWNEIWASYANRCLLEAFSLLPSTHTLYLLTDNYSAHGNIGWDEMQKKLRQLHKNSVSPLELSSEYPYALYLKSPSSYLEVSQRDQHPSKQAHALYAELLYKHLEPLLTGP